MKLLDAYKLEIMILDDSKISTEEFVDWVREAIETHIEECTATVKLLEKFENVMPKGDCELAEA